LLAPPETQKARDHRVVVAGLVVLKRRLVGQVSRRARATGAAGRPVVGDPSGVVVVMRVLRRTMWAC
jgi:hypothetical protein